MKFADAAINLLEAPISFGSFTNHGKFISTAEPRINLLFKNKFKSAIFGSRAIGIGVLLWIYRNDNLDLFGFSEKDYFAIIEIFGYSNFQNQQVNFVNYNDISRSDKKKEYSKSILISNHQNFSDLQKQITKSDFDCVFITYLESTKFNQEIQNMIDYSIVLFSKESDYTIATNMRSSYGAVQTEMEVIATLNGRPSEIVGNLINQIIDELGHVSK